MLGLPPTLSGCGASGLSVLRAGGPVGLMNSGCDDGVASGAGTIFAGSLELARCGSILSGGLRLSGGAKPG